MIVASVSEAKNKLSALLAKVKAGETVVILDRGRPVARLTPPVSSDDPDEARLDRLERAGIIKRGTGRPVRSIIDEPPPKLPPGVSAVEELLKERREGR